MTRMVAPRTLCRDPKRRRITMPAVAGGGGIRGLLVLLRSPNLPFLRCLSSSLSPATPAAASAVASDFAVTYLVSSCGLSPDVAARAAAGGKLRFVSSERADSFLGLLRSHGFTKSNISRLISLHPTLLGYHDAEDKIKPKLEFLALIGLSPSQICSTPVLLALSLERRLRPSLNSLATALGSTEVATKTISRWPRIICYNLQERLLSNLETLRQFGLPVESIHMVAMKYCQVLAVPPNSLVKHLNWVREKGFNPCSKMFSHALFMRSKLKNSTWDRKFRAFRDIGWTEEEVLWAFKRRPFVIALSEEKVKKMSSFYEAEFGWGKNVISADPTLLGLSLEKRVRPRRLVLEFLRLNGKFSRNILPDDFRSSERIFLNKYVYKYGDEYPEIFDAYKLKGIDAEISTKKSKGRRKKEG